MNTNIANIEDHMRSAGRIELIHYAGAAHRDPVAYALCCEYANDSTVSEETLKARALKAAYGWTVSPENLGGAS